MTSIFIRNRVSWALAAGLVWGAGAARAASWSQVNIQGLGFVTNIQESPLADATLFARTDVGGMYAFDKSANAWRPLLGGHRFAAGDLQRMMMVESFAVARNAPGHLFVAVGSTSKDTKDAPANGTLMESTDNGVTWASRPITVPGLGRAAIVHGNGEYRQCGERLSVHPDSAQQLLFGTRVDGLLYSRDGGQTWRVPAVANVPQGPEPLGVTFTAWSKNAAGAVTAYAGVAGRGIYRSTTSLDSWELVPGTSLPTDAYYVQAVTDKNGVLYATWTNTSRTTGSVLRWDGKTAAQLAPLGARGYLSLGVSADGKRIAVRSAQAGPNAFAVSQDAGATWVSPAFDEAQVANRIQWYPPYVYAWDTGYEGGLVWRTGASSELWYSNGSGVFKTANAFTTAASWTPVMKNLEELVVDVVHALKGASVKLIVATWDMHGFAMKDPAVVPTRAIRTESNGQTSFGRISSVASSETVPQTVVYAGSNQNYEGSSQFQSYLMLSQDGGATWQSLNRPNARAVEGEVAVSSDGQHIVWLAKTETGDAWAGAQMYQTSDQGRSWTAIRGLTGPLGLFFPSAYLGGGTTPLAADPVQAEVFYAAQCSSENSWAMQFYRSEDGGKNFAKTFAPAWDAGFKCGNKLELKAVPGRTGDVWYVNTELGGDKLYRSTDGTKTFAAVPGVTTAFRIAFGAPKVAGANPALYMWGVVGGQLGLYRSDDATKLVAGQTPTWTKVSTGADPFPQVDSLDADKLVYGRVYVGTAGHGAFYMDAAAPVVTPPPTTTPPPATTTPPPTTPPTAGRAIPSNGIVQAADFRVKTTGVSPGGGKWNLLSNGSISDTFAFTKATKYIIWIQSAGSPVGGVYPIMTVVVDGKGVGSKTVVGTDYVARGYEVSLTAGDHKVEIRFTNDAMTSKEDRNLYLGAVKLEAH